MKTLCMLGAGCNAFLVGLALAAGNGELAWAWGVATVWALSALFSELRSAA